jgi:phenylacetate-CoA ligase
MATTHGGFAAMARQTLSGSVLLPAFWAAKRLPVIARYKKFASVQWDAKEVFQARRDLMLKHLLRHTIDRVPFYRPFRSDDMVRLIEADPSKALLSMPILTKDDLRKSLGDLHVPWGRRTILNSSGGSTGVPVRVYQDEDHLSNALAVKMLFYEWAGRHHAARMVKLWGAERDLVAGGQGWKQQLADVVGNVKTINAFRLSPERMTQYVKLINSFKPVCLEGYAESLYEFSAFIARGDLGVAALDTIVSSGGTLHPHMRERIQGTFSAPVFDRYGSREAGDMAAECEQHNGLHVFGETIIIEVVDEAGNGVEEGEEGEILVTNLVNYTMPLIRYRIGDRAVRGCSSCGCGRPYPLLEKITGRSGSTFRTRDGGVASPEFFIHLIGVMCNRGTIGKFQVIQESYDRILIRLTPFQGTSLKTWEDQEKAAQLIRKVMGDQCAVDVRIEAEIEPTPTGKHLYTICRLNHV